MKSSIEQAAVRRHLRRAETRPRMAKADLRKAEDEANRGVIGKCVDRARLSLGWNLDEFAHRVKRDPRQVARWFSGAENPNLDAVIAVVEMRAPLLLELAGLSDAVEVETTIRVRRTA